MELYQRIEHLIGKQLPLYQTEEEEVKMLGERVAEAQRFAKLVSEENYELVPSRPGRSKSMGCL